MEKEILIFGKSNNKLELIVRYYLCLLFFLFHLHSNKNQFRFYFQKIPFYQKIVYIFDILFQILFD